ncbi:MAG: hypothetical protein KK482_27430, partial [Sinorhizobium meliloti]|nr:hypothetical protein [Sinorhizobium meliloti]
RPQNLQKPACRSFFNTANGNPLAKIRMPAIKNLNFIADMGRMNGALPAPETLHVCGMSAPERCERESRHSPGRAMSSPGPIARAALATGVGRSGAGSKLGEKRSKILVSAISVRTTPIIA